jgi:hypothetical protein
MVCVDGTILQTVLIQIEQYNIEYLFDIKKKIKITIL